MEAVGARVGVGLRVGDGVGLVITELVRGIVTGCISG